MFARAVPGFAHVRQEDAIFTIAGYREAHRITSAFGWKVRAAGRVA